MFSKSQRNPDPAISPIIIDIVRVISTLILIIVEHATFGLLLIRIPSVGGRLVETKKKRETVTTSAMVVLIL